MTPPRGPSAMLQAQLLKSFRKTCEARLPLSTRGNGRNCLSVHCMRITISETLRYNSRSRLTCSH